MIADNSKMEMAADNEQPMPRNEHKYLEDEFGNKIEIEGWE